MLLEISTPKQQHFKASPGPCLLSVHPYRHPNLSPNPQRSEDCPPPHAPGTTMICPHPWDQATVNRGLLKPQGKVNPSSLRMSVGCFGYGDIEWLIHPAFILGFANCGILFIFFYPPKTERLNKAGVLVWHEEGGDPLTSSLGCVLLFSLLRQNTRQKNLRKEFFYAGGGGARL